MSTFTPEERAAQFMREAKHAGERFPDDGYGFEKRIAAAIREAVAAETARLEARLREVELHALFLLQSVGGPSQHLIPANNLRVVLGLLGKDERADDATVREREIRAAIQIQRGAQP